MINGVFNDFERFIKSVVNENTPKSMLALGMFACAAIHYGARFYLPESEQVLKRPDEAVRPLIRLPNKVTVLLDECLFHGISQTGWSITIACPCNDDGLLKQFFPSLESRLDIDAADDSFYLVHASRAPTNRSWMLYPTIGHCAWDDKANEYTLLCGLAKDISDTFRREFNGHSMEQEIAPGAWGMLNLCAMLNLENVEKRTVQAPRALNKKRERNQKGPLYSYHVLVVDGERWDSPRRPLGDGTLRSHFRRGHVRHLDDSRATWVRATVVHGRKEGFVDKDYLVKT